MPGWQDAPTVDQQSAAAAPSPTQPGAGGYMDDDEFAAVANRAYGPGNWRQTGGWRSQAREDQLRAQGAQTVAPGHISRHSLGEPGAPGARDIQVTGESPAEAAARLRALDAPIGTLYPEGAAGGQGAHLHINMQPGARPSWQDAPAAGAPGAAATPAPAARRPSWQDAPVAGQAPQQRPAAPAPAPGRQGWLQTAAPWLLGAVNPVAGLAMAGGQQIATSLIGGAEAGAGKAATAFGQWSAQQGVENIRHARETVLMGPEKAGQGAYEEALDEIRAQNAPDANRLVTQSLAAGQKLFQLAAQTAPANRNWLQSLAYGAGGFLPAMVASAYTPAAAPAIFAAQGYGDTFQDALAKGKTPEEAHHAAEQNALVQGIITALPVGKAAEFGVSKVGGGLVAKGLAQFAARGAADAAMGTGMSIGANAVAIGNYDPNRSLTSGTLDTAAQMGVAGLIMEGLGLAKGFVLRPREAPKTEAPADQPPGAPPGGPSMPETNAAQAYKDLTQARMARADPKVAANDNTAAAVAPPNTSIPGETEPPKTPGVTPTRRGPPPRAATPADYEAARLKHGAPAEYMPQAISDVAELRGAAPPRYSLFAAIKDLGGLKLKDDEGRLLPGPDASSVLQDVRDPRIQPQKGRALTPEKMAEALAEQGWFGEPAKAGDVDPGDLFIAALAKERAAVGNVANRYYHPDSDTPVVLARRAQLEADFDAAGIVSGDTRAEAAAKLAAYRHGESLKLGDNMDALRARAADLGLTVPDGMNYDELLGDVVERESIQDEYDGWAGDRDERLIDHALTTEEEEWLGRPFEEIAHPEREHAEEREVGREHREEPERVAAAETRPEGERGPPEAPGGPGGGPPPEPRAPGGDREPRPSAGGGGGGAAAPPGEAELAERQAAYDKAGAAVSAAYVKFGDLQDRSRRGEATHEQVMAAREEWYTAKDALDKAEKALLEAEPVGPQSAARQRLGEQLTTPREPEPEQAELLPPSGQLNPALTAIQAAQGVQQDATEAARTPEEEELAGRLTDGAEPTDDDITSLGLPSPAPLEHLAPVVQRLFGVAANKVRQAMGSALWRVWTGSGGASWQADPKAALMNAALWVKERFGRPDNTKPDDEVFLARSVAKNRKDWDIATGLAAQYRQDNEPIRFTHPSGRTALAGPDHENPGQFRVEFFDQAGEPDGDAGKHTVLVNLLHLLLESDHIPQAGRRRYPDEASHDEALRLAGGDPSMSFLARAPYIVKINNAIKATLGFDRLWSALTPDQRNAVIERLRAEGTPPPPTRDQIRAQEDQRIGERNAATVTTKLEYPKGKAEHGSISAFQMPDGSWEASWGGGTRIGARFAGTDPHPTERGAIREALDGIEKVAQGEAERSDSVASNASRAAAKRLLKWVEQQRAKYPDEEAKPVEAPKPAFDEAAARTSLRNDLRILLRVSDDIRRGIDPNTGAPFPAGEAGDARRQELEQALKETQGRYDQTLNEYEGRFGREARYRFENQVREGFDAGPAPGTPSTETVRLGGETVEQGLFAGGEASARQAAAARGETLRPTRPQERPGGLFAEPEPPQGELFGPGGGAPAEERLPITPEFRERMERRRQARADTVAQFPGANPNAFTPEQRRYYEARLAQLHAAAERGEQPLAGPDLRQRAAAAAKTYAGDDDARGHGFLHGATGADRDPWPEPISDGYNEGYDAGKAWAARTGTAEAPPALSPEGAERIANMTKARDVTANQIKKVEESIHRRVKPPGRLRTRPPTAAEVADRREKSARQLAALRAKLDRQNAAIDRAAQRGGAEEPAAEAAARAPDPERLTAMRKAREDTYGQIRAIEKSIEQRALARTQAQVEHPRPHLQKPGLSGWRKRDQEVYDRELPNERALRQKELDALNAKLERQTAAIEPLQAAALAASTEETAPSRRARPAPGRPYTPSIGDTVHWNHPLTGEAHEGVVKEPNRYYRGEWYVTHSNGHISSVKTRDLREGEHPDPDSVITPQGTPMGPGARFNIVGARAAPDKNTGVHNGKRFWSGAFDVRDGHILETHPYERAEAADFHHTQYFSPNALDEMVEGNASFFWVDELGQLHTDWRNTDPISRDVVRRLRNNLDNGRDIRIAQGPRFNITSAGQRNHPDLFDAMEPIAGRAPKGPFRKPADRGAHFDQNHADLYRLGEAARKGSATPMQLSAEANRLAEEMGRYMDWSTAEVTPAERARIEESGRPSPAEMVRVAKRYVRDFADPEKRGDALYDPDRYDQVVRRYYESQGNDQVKLSVTGKPVPFYSAVERYIDLHPRQSGTADDWSGILNSGPVKKDELNWIGVQAYLKLLEELGQREQLGRWMESPEAAAGDPMPEVDKLKPVIIDKQQVLEFIRNNGVVVHEVDLVTPHVNGSSKYLTMRLNRLIEQARNEYIGDQGDEFHDYMHTEIANDGILYRELTRIDPALEHDDDWATTVLNDAMPGWDKGGAPWYAGYQLPGGEGYHEVLLTLPDMKLGGYSSHYEGMTNPDIPGVFAHVRFNVRHTPDGKLVLFIEEIQSDLHQTGRKLGYRQSFTQEDKDAAEERHHDATQTLLDEVAELRHLAPHFLVSFMGHIGQRAEEELAKWHEDERQRAADGRYSTTPFEYNRLRRLRDTADDLAWKIDHNTYRGDALSLVREIEELHREAGPSGAVITDQLERARNAQRTRDEAYTRWHDMTNPKGVTSAPFTTTWHNLVMKRMIVWAVEHGYDRIAWTTGDQQTERYPERFPYVNDIHVNRHPDGEDFNVRMANNVALVADRYGFGERERQPDNSGYSTVRMTRKEMERGFGKKLAAQAADTAAEHGQFGTEIDLSHVRLGEQGMRGFYGGPGAEDAAKLVTDTGKLIKPHGATVGEGPVVVTKRAGAGSRVLRDVDTRIALLRQRGAVPEGATVADIDRAADRGRQHHADDSRVYNELGTRFDHGPVEAAETSAMRAGVLARIQRLSYRISTLTELAKLIRERANMVLQQPGFDITAALRASVQAGMPLFQRVAARGRLAPDERQVGNVRYRLDTSKGRPGRGVYLIDTPSGGRLYGRPAVELNKAAENLVRRVEAELARLAPGVKPRVFGEMPVDDPALQAGGRVTGVYYPKGLAHVIAWALETEEPELTRDTDVGGGGGAIKTIRHEAMHYLRRAGLFTRDEWMRLKAHAIDKKWMDRFKVRERYPGFSPDEQLEEAISDGVAFGRLNRYQFYRDLPPAVRDVIRKIDHALIRVGAIARQVFAPHSRPSVAEIMMRIESGEVGRRSPLPFGENAYPRDAFEDLARQGSVRAEGNHLANVRAIVAGAKPATDVPAVAPNDAAKIRQLIVDHGLTAEPSPHVGGTTLIGGSPKTVDALKDAVTDFERGKAYGYTDADIAAYYKQQGIVNGVDPKVRFNADRRAYSQGEAHELVPAPSQGGVARFNIAEKPPEPEEVKARSFVNKMLGEGMDEVGRRLSRATARFMPDPVKEFVDAVGMRLNPMARGGERAQAMAKDFANSLREHLWQWARMDGWLAKSFKPDERRLMWRAADEESVLRQRGLTPGPDQGLNRLDDRQRAVVEELQRRAQVAFDMAVALGMVEGPGLPSYAPRMIVQMTAAGPRRFMGKRTGTPDAVGRNLITDTPQLRHRGYLTAEETLAAAQRKLGPEAVIIEDIRTLAAATGKLEQAIAGKRLVEQIKAAGRDTQQELVHQGGAPDTREVFTLDHPALKVWTPKLVRDPDTGKMVTIENPATGTPVMIEQPLYIDREFEGPLRAVLSQAPGAVEKALMALKGKVMSIIMFSPLMHNMVILGKALPVLLAQRPDRAIRSIFMLGAYRDGFKVKQDPERMAFWIRNGLDPIGRRYFNQDITAIMQDPNIAPGRSWTAQILGGIANLAGKPVSAIARLDPTRPDGGEVLGQRWGDDVKRAVDQFGNLWHNTFLWDRIGDLQLGLAEIMHHSFVAAGHDDVTAARIAAHFANRYAGALPMEAMSRLARNLANVALFSRSFTMTNIGAWKDAVTGLPTDIQAQIKRDAGLAALQRAQGSARGKAMSMIAIDLVAAHVGMLMVSSAMYWLYNAVFKQPWALQIGNPMDKWILDHLGATGMLERAGIKTAGPNEPGKEDRVLVGYDADGTALYARLPMGKFIEDAFGWVTDPIGETEKKFSPLFRFGYEWAANDKGFGRKLYDPYDKSVAGHFKNLSRVVLGADISSVRQPDDFTGGLLGSFVPAGLIQGAIHWGMHEGDPNTAMLQTLLPWMGVTISHGAPGGPAAGEYFAIKDEHDFKIAEAMPGIRGLIRQGKTAEAFRQMVELGMSPSQRRYTVRTTMNPASRLTGAQAARLRQHGDPDTVEQMQRDLDAERERQAEEQTLEPAAQ